MRVPARVYADDELLAAMLEGEAMTQLANVATLPGVVGCVYGMPDMHEGYGFPVGGVAATLLPDGVISPGGIGFDINCGVRLLTSNRKRTDIKHIEALLQELMRSIPAGFCRHDRPEITESQMDDVLLRGARA